MSALEKEWLEQFKQYLKVERQYSEATITSYFEDLNEFCRFLDESGGLKSFKDINNIDVHAYMSWLYDRELKTTTVSRKISSLRAFYRFLVRNDKADQDPLHTFP